MPRTRRGTARRDAIAADDSRVKLDLLGPLSLLSRGSSTRRCPLSSLPGSPAALPSPSPAAHCHARQRPLRTPQPCPPPPPLSEAPSAAAGLRRREEKRDTCLGEGKETEHNKYMDD
ncbi:hypothetical protein DAI22_01g162650 [Oryza sativa Japonica Group]|nr:hypothetical protein DAI22_01g162650 [Oryza sativa Japonica Group]